MKLSIKFLAIVAVLVSLNLTAFAQKGDKSRTPEQRAERMTTKMIEKLNLDTYQSTKVKELNLTLATNLKAIKDAHQGDREAARPKVKALKENHKVALQDVLTAEQWDKLVEYRKNRRDGKGGKKAKRGK